ncbi:MAG: fasciclin domain-containing protein [Candidatus Sericytochromatia bacterium]|nr:fasciclin domain-containing protein [Candidatus Sericytochromatia bacterium]
MRQGGRLALALGVVWLAACTQARVTSVGPSPATGVVVAALSPTPLPRETPTGGPASPVPTAAASAAPSPLPTGRPEVGLPPGEPGSLAPAPVLTPVPPSPAPPASPSPTPDPLASGAATVVALVEGRADTRTLAELVALAGLAGTLGGAGPITLFAPTDAAFAKLPVGDVAALRRPEGRQSLQRILTHHAVPGSLDRARLVDGRLTPLDGVSLAVTTRDGQPRIAEAAIETADLVAGNGLVHTIDTVLVPPDLVLGPATLAELVASDPALSLLQQALVAAGLEPTLRGTGPFTLFAPVDAGFDQLAPGALARLLEPANQATLASLLRYHLVDGQRPSGGIAAGGLPTLLGPALPATTGPLRVAGQAVLVPDRFAGNGVLHTVEGLLFPPGLVLP